MIRKSYKFGGASVKNADGVRNAAEIIRQEESVIVVVSAMGKTTNALEKVVDAYFKGESTDEWLEESKGYHLEILNALFPEENSPAMESLNKVFAYCQKYLEHAQGKSYDEVYDQIVPAGELLSTRILSAYLQAQEVDHHWLDARKLIVTDDRFRKANILWAETSEAIHHAVKEKGIYLTQGFIGGTSENRMTTLGREGSDYSASIFTNILETESLTVWKDVEGILNADPRYFRNTEKLDHLSFREAIELAYYGATIIHPKTIKPLQNKNIPLFIRSFEDPELEGTRVDSDTSDDTQLPIYIYKPSLVLLSISPKDFSFIGEKQLSDIFSILYKHKLEVSMMQNSAINFSLVLDAEKSKLHAALDEIREDFRVLYNENLQLMTVRHYNQKVLQDIVSGKEVLMEQKTRGTLKILFR
ncbi:aspartate kinase [bacterium SCSIO 12741]|nr:aspartate kinase [bacterium SCSIO 12741]